MTLQLQLKMCHKKTVCTHIVQHAYQHQQFVLLSSCVCLFGAQRFVEAWLGQTVLMFIEGSLKPFACFCVALRSVEVCLERTSTAFIEASLEPFASFLKKMSFALRSVEVGLGEPKRCLLKEALSRLHGSMPLRFDPTLAFIILKGLSQAGPQRSMT